jgi:hypothetical protein
MKINLHLNTLQEMYVSWLRQPADRRTRYLRYNKTLRLVICTNGLMIP